MCKKLRLWLLIRSFVAIYSDSADDSASNSAFFPYVALWRSIFQLARIFERYTITILLHADPLDCLYSETERQREKERLAAIAIQTNWRMLKVKWNFKKKVRACVLVSRVFRGHIARLRVDGTKQRRN